MNPPSRLFRVAAHVGILAGIAFTIAAAPSRTFLPTLGISVALAYEAGRTRPLHRVYRRLDDANDRALRDWREGNWRVLAAHAAGFIALHPAWFARGWWKARAERREDRAAARRWQHGAAAKPARAELDELKARVDAALRGKP